MLISIFFFLGINQNEMIYDFMLEKSWRSTLSSNEIGDW